MSIKKKAVEVEKLNIVSFYKDIVNVYKSYFENNGFTMSQAIPIKEMNLSGETSYDIKMRFSDNKTYNFTLVIHVFKVRKSFSSPMEYSFSRRFNGEINNRKIRGINDFVDYKKVFLPNTLVSTNWFKNIFKTIENKKFSKADAILFLNKHLLINKRFGDFGKQDYMVMIKDGIGIKVYRQTFERVPFWVVGSIYISESPYKMRLSKQHFKMKSFDESEEKLKDLIRYVNEISKQVKFE